MPSPTRTRVELMLTQQERSALDAQAQAHGLTRSDYMRARLFTSQQDTPALPSIQTYSRAVTAALKASNGAVNRAVAEAITAAIITKLYGLS